MAPSYANIFMASLQNRNVASFSLQPFTIHLACASSTTFSCFGPTRPPASQPSSNTSTHSTPKSNSATSNLTLPSNSWTPQSYSLKNLHYNPHSTSNSPTKVYYSTTPITTQQPVKKTSFTAKPFDNDVSSPMMTTYGYSYYDYTKSSHSTITTAINKATSQTHSQLLQHKPPPSTTSVHIPFVIPYNTDLPPISHTVRKHWHLIQNDPTLSQLFPRQPFL